MSWSIAFRLATGEESGLDFGSSNDVMTLSDWVETLPAQEFPSLRKLMVEGEFIDPTLGLDDVDRALQDHSPKDKEVEQLAELLGDLLDRWPDGTLAILDDGANVAGWDELLGLEPRGEAKSDRTETEG